MLRTAVSGIERITVKREPFAHEFGTKWTLCDMFSRQWALCEDLRSLQRPSLGQKLELSFALKIYRLENQFPCNMLICVNSFASDVSLMFSQVDLPEGIFHVFSVRKPDLPCGFPMDFFPNIVLGISTARLPWSRMTTKSFGKPSVPFAALPF